MLHLVPEQLVLWTLHSTVCCCLVIRHPIVSLHQTHPIFVVGLLYSFTPLIPSPLPTTSFQPFVFILLHFVHSPCDLLLVNVFVDLPYLPSSFSLPVPCFHRSVDLPYLPSSFSLPLPCFHRSFPVLHFRRHLFRVLRVIPT